jgi:cysteine desulfurase family protein (TIGR01976 family)
VLAAQDAGVTVQRVAVNHEDCTIDLDDLKAKLSGRTKLVAVTCASNGVGTIPPIRQINDMAHDVGAKVFLDAVHFAPHLAMDVKAWDCDYITCSAYKFFGPHVGVLWGRRKLLEELPAYKLRPAPDDLPGRWMTGTQNHEGIAGTLAAIDYLTELGRRVAPDVSDRRAALLAAYEAIGKHERSLTGHLLLRLAEFQEVKVWGITNPDRLHERVPTVSLTHSRYTSLELAKYLAERGIYTWHGNYYALPLTEALDLEPEGMLRVGLLHYNTAEEIDRLLDALRGL